MKLLNYKSIEHIKSLVAKVSCTGVLLKSCRVKRLCNFKSYHIIAYSVRYSRGESSERDGY